MKKFEGHIGDIAIYSDTDLPYDHGGIVIPVKWGCVLVDRCLLQDIYKILPDKESKEAKEIQNLLTEVANR